jgi:ribonuclease T2
MLTVALAALLASSATLRAQAKAEPGRFDFYLLDLPWGPEFCSIADVSPQCLPQRRFVVHGLWPQNNDGSYPVFCSDEPAPLHPAKNLDLTPDLKLLSHEWQKHGTCSAVGPQRFFALERQAFSSLKIPSALDHVDRELSLSPDKILDLFYKANPGFPKGSLLLSCRNDHLTAVEACFSKSLKPISCRGLHSCPASTVKLAPIAATSHP